MDRTTEAIAHFIGLFAVTVEEARSREAYEKFLLDKGDAPDMPVLPSIDLAFSAPYELQGYDPGFQYVAPPPNWYLYSPWMSVSFKSPEIPITNLQLFAFPGFLTPVAVGSGYNIVLPEIDIVGSVASFVHQGIYLSDDDYFGVGGHGLLFSPAPVSLELLNALADAAAALSPLPDVGMPGSAAAMRDFASQTIEALDSYQPASAPGTTVFVEKATTLEGTWVNGAKVDEAPEITDHFSLEDKLDQRPYTKEPLPQNAKLIDGQHFEVEAKVNVQTGGNVLVNNAVVTNLWTASTVTAVLGDHIELNVIIQINAWCDTDVVTSAISDWDKDPVGTNAFNLATFERYDTSGMAAGSASQTFPKYWVVEQIDGDLMIVNWLQQLTFMSDNDVGIVSSSGVSTSVYAGGNIAFNTISIYELAFAYDLIIVGGSVFDLNIIHQLNLLYDNDLIGAVAGFQSTGPGSVSTSNNLLWNDAYIYNIGGAHRFDSLPDHYRETANQLAKGDDSLSNGVLTDPSFAGYGLLKVLYITGDLFNVHYIKQTNILSDGDQLALAMHASDPFPDAEWTVATGSNALINNAAIVDLDSLGKTYVGGSQYSQDVLIQADIISTDPEFGFQNPDVLVNEAIAFLNDETLDDNDNGYQQPGALDPDNAQGDALQTLIG